MLLYTCRPNFQIEVLEGSKKVSYIYEGVLQIEIP